MIAFLTKVYNMHVVCRYLGYWTWTVAALFIVYIITKECMESSSLVILPGSGTHISPAWLFPGLGQTWDMKLKRWLWIGDD